VFGSVIALCCSPNVLHVSMPSTPGHLAAPWRPLFSSVRGSPHPGRFSPLPEARRRSRCSTPESRDAGAHPRPCAAAVPPVRGRSLPNRRRNRLREGCARMPRGSAEQRAKISPSEEGTTKVRRTRPASKDASPRSGLRAACGRLRGASGVP
jgi:hypothetical protein